MAACYNRESDDVKRLRGELEEIGGDSYLAQADVSDPASAEAFARDASERFGGLDILINNAGVVGHAMIGDLDLEEWHRVLDTNLTAIYFVTKAALPAMGEGSSIVNITSAVAMRGMPARTHYISSKAGLIGFTRALCKEVGRRGIRVNALAPGIIETDQTAELDDAGRDPVLPGSLRWTGWGARRRSQRGALPGERPRELRLRRDAERRRRHLGARRGQASATFLPASSMLKCP